MKLEAELGKQDIFRQRLKTSHAFHSSLMDPILDEFRQAVRKVNLQKPRIPYISNLTGSWISDAMATDPESWVHHLRNTVRFADGVAELTKSAERVFVEAGPGTTLSSFVKRRLNFSPSSRAIGLDQIPESLIPLLACRGTLSLTTLDVIIGTAGFALGAVSLSPLLHRIGIRDHPF